MSITDWPLPCCLPLDELAPLPVAALLALLPLPSGASLSLSLPRPFQPASCFIIVGLTHLVLGWD